MSAMNWGAAASFPAVYEELHIPAYFRAFAENLVDRAALAPGERLLDVACGTGVVLRAAIDREPELRSAVGLDLTESMLAIARERLAGTQATLIHGSALELPLDDDSFDVATCQQGFQFFPDRAQAMAELRRVLVPGGRVLVSVWAEIEASPAKAVVAREIAAVAPEIAAVPRNPFAFSDGDALVALLRDAGFTDVALARVERTARYDSPDTLARAWLEGTPVSLALAELDDATRSTITARVTEAIRGGFPDGTTSMVTNVATGRA